MKSLYYIFIFIAHTFANDINKISGIVYDEEINPIYNLHLGANLISYTKKETINIENAFSSNIQADIISVITEGEASIQLSPNQWVGSLNSFEAGKGYWVITSSSISFSF